jgi:hypothetical protein
MTPEQKQMVRLIVHSVSLADDAETLEAHHGDCIGADADFHEIVKETTAWTVGHLPDKNGKRAFCDFDETTVPMPYLDRNRSIVAEADYLIATPSNYLELKQGSGTWATWRYATKAGVPRVMIFPDGSLDMHFS